MTFSGWNLSNAATSTKKTGHNHASSPGLQEDDVRKRQDRLAEICLRYTPHVGLVEDPHSDSLFLELTDIQHLIPDERRFVIQLLMDCHREGYFPTKIAVADTPGAAWAMTHFGTGPRATEISSAWILPPSESKKWIASLPVEALRIPDLVAEWCHELGLHRIGDLIHFPMAELRKRFGEILVLRLEQLLGSRQEILSPYLPQPQFEEHLWLEYPARSWEHLSPSLSAFLKRLTQQLVSHNVGALGLRVNLLCEDHSAVTLSVSLFRPSIDPHHLSGLIELGFRQKHFSSPIVGINAVVSHVAPLESHQATLFPDGETDWPSSEWGHLLERLSCRLGTARVCYAVLNPDHDPEKAYFWYPCLSHRKSHKPRSDGKALVTKGPRPVRLFRAPIPIQVVTAIPSGVPYQIHHQGQSHHVVRWWGPERIQTGWWRGESITRDYYRVELQNGVHYWIYRCLESGTWFLHGTFG